MYSKQQKFRHAAAMFWAGGIAFNSLAFAAGETIETIVVTAQARDQTAEEVPIAMQVVTMDQIADLGAINLSKMNGYFPGFTVSGDQPTQPNYALRGIGTGDFGITTDAPVGVYVDGVYTGKTGGALLNFNDVQRVEVLKGPQGTLFGRNSAAGAIAIYTNQPTRETTASGLVRVGSFDTRYFEGVANSPLNDNIAARVSFVNNRSDGWVTNRTTDKKMGDDGDWGSRLAFKWTPGSDVEAILSWEHEDLDQSARPAFGVVKVPAGTAPTTPPVASSFVSPFDAPLENDAPGREKRKFDGVALHFNAPIDNLTFSSTTAYRNFNSSNREDNDGSANLATYLDTTNAETNRSWQQEFRLAAESDLFDWVAGASYFYSRADQNSDVVTYTNTLNTIFGAPVYAAPMLGNSWTEVMENTAAARAASVYGDTIWHATSALNVTLGVRWTRDDKSASWYTPQRSSPGLDPATDPLAGITNLIFADAANAASSKVTDSKTWYNTSPRLVVDYTLSPDSMLFASASRGYQAGGFDVFQPYATFDPEYMTNYEIGSKNYFPEMGLTVNGSIFHYRFTGLQSIALVPSNNPVPVYEIDNSDISANGVDVDASFKITDDIRIFGGGEYLDQRYDKKTFTSNITNTAEDASGQPVGAPFWTAMGGVNMGWELFTGRAEFNLQGNYTSETRCNQQLSEEFGCLSEGPVRTGRATTRVDTRLGWQTADGRFGTALIVNNVFDKRYITSAPGGQATWVLGSPYVSITPPRFVGIEFKASM